MSYTTTQLATAVLKHLNVVGAIEVATSSDITFVTDAYNQKWEELTAHGLELTYWPADEIPAPVFLIVRDLIMLEVQVAYGEPIAPEEKDAREAIILRRLRRHVQHQSSNTPIKPAYF